MDNSASFTKLRASLMGAAIDILRNTPQETVLLLPELKKLPGGKMEKASTFTIGLRKNGKELHDRKVTADLEGRIASIIERYNTRQTAQLVQNGLTVSLEKVKAEPVADKAEKAAAAPAAPVRDTKKDKKHR